MSDDPHTRARGDASHAAMAVLSVSSSRCSPNWVTTSCKSPPHASQRRPVLCLCRPLCGLVEVTSNAR